MSELSKLSDDQATALIGLATETLLHIGMMEENERTETA